MNVLGVSCFYHDSAACLVRDGEILAAAEEERFSRRKHDHSFPQMAIDYCLRRAGIEGRQLDAVAFYEKPLRKLERALHVGKSFGDCSTELVDLEIRQFAYEGAHIGRRLQEALGFSKAIHYSEHHLSHAASAFFPSPFEDAAVLTVDGVGEWATASQFLGTDRQLTLKREISYPHSLGMLYAAMTAYLGFEVNEGEYKVMGLASYGEPKHVDKLEQLIELLPDASFRNNLEYFSYPYSIHKMYTDNLIELLGPERHSDEDVTQRHMDIASSLQVVTERAMIGLVRSFRRYTDTPNLVLAGGVAHNVVANTRILEDGTFKNLFVQPASGDSGAAIGAALYTYYHALERPRLTNATYNTCLGPAFSAEEIERSLVEHGLAAERIDFPTLAKKTAELIRDDFIVGWFQGSMEFGPRALGNRSLLANACNPKMKDILNSRVKLREDFRPFAPAVLEEVASEYFVLDGPSPFMLLTPQVQARRRDEIPAVTHVDGSARVQTVSAEQNPRFHRLIHEFGQLTGIPVIINTSFNVRGEPIVCSPDDAITCFLRTEIDFLVIGDWLVSKPY